MRYSWRLLRLRPHFRSHFRISSNSSHCQERCREDLFKSECEKHQ
ncbi:hypothetical protein IC582_020611 [Cucumis melo]